MERARDRLHLRRTTEQHVPEVEVQVKRRRTASLSNQDLSPVQRQCGPDQDNRCQLYPRRSQQQQVPVVDFQAELRQAFLAETPRGG
uniref:Small nuclear ribonucleoprotein polypeptide N n=1 Tax=Rhinolophus ferrumequinum TaxID=59479 RepID=A0A671FZN9_RHIFE